MRAESGPVTHLAGLKDATYLRDASGELYRFDGKVVQVIDHEIHGIAGDGDILLVCRNSGELEVRRAGAVVLRHRCARTVTTHAMSVTAGDYAALSDDGTLVFSHRGRPLTLSTGILGEYELELSNRGVIGIIDYAGDGKAWFARPGGARLEPSPSHGSQPWSVSADGDLVAWGYKDGTALVLDTMTEVTRELRGHPGPVSQLVVEAAHARVISASALELWIWNTGAAPMRMIAKMPCATSHIEPSPDGAYVALDCNDGGVQVWARRTGTVTQVARHVGYSVGLQWMQGMVCFGERGEKRIECVNPDGAARQVRESSLVEVSVMAAMPDHPALSVAGTDGKVWRVDDSFHELYTHDAWVYDLVPSPDGRAIASFAADGSVAVFDVLRNQLAARVFAHAGLQGGVTWLRDELWSWGSEGTIKRWAIHDGALRLQHLVQLPGRLRLLKVASGAWAAVVGSGELLVSRDGASIAMRIDAGRSLTAIEISSDARYVAAIASNEIVVVDLQRSAIATMTASGPVEQLRFLEPGLLAFSEPGALKTLQVDQLAYVPYVATPEPPNRASF